MCVKRVVSRFLFYLEVAKAALAVALIFVRYYVNAFIQLFFPKPLKSLKDDTILIIGAANGIGRELCLQLANTGALLICWDISKRNNDNLVSELRTLRCQAFGYQVDITERTVVEELTKKNREEIGEVTLIINTVGIIPCHPFLSHNPREIQRVFQVNVIGHIWVIREWLPSMMERKKGHIVTVCSTGGLIGMENAVPYCGSQHAIHGTIEALKEEVKNHPDQPDIKFTTVFPNHWNSKFSKNNVISKFSKILPPTLDPSEIARGTIAGIQRNDEFVYIPAFSQFLGTTLRALPPTIQKSIRNMIEYQIQPEPLNVR